MSEPIAAARPSITRHWIALLMALQFLTTLPVKGSQELNKPAMGLSLLYYPLVGLLLGILMLGVALLGQVLFSPLLTAVLVVAAWVLLTGALHIDGLADCADAWVGGLGSRERTLTLMKDPTSGPVAIAVVAMLLLVKVAAVTELIVTSYIGALVLAPVLARLSVLVLFLTTPYVRKAGLGEILLEYFPRRAAVALCFGLVALLLWKTFYLGLVLVFASVLTLGTLRRLMMSRLGGCTGDTIGATIEVMEAVSVVALLAAVAIK